MASRVSTNVFSVTSNSTARLYVEFDLSSQSVANNTSTINWRTGWTGTGAPSFYSNAIKILGGSVAGAALSAGTWSNQSGAGDHQLQSGTLTVAHNSVGDATVSLSISGSFYGSGTLSGSGSFTLPRIARASSITSVTASVPLDGSAKATVAILRADSSFTHKVEWLAPDGTVIVTQQDQATSASITPVAATWLAHLPNATSGTATVRVTTMTGSTVIGAPVSKTFTVTVPATVVPTVSAALTVTRTGQTALAAYVQGLSGVTIGFSGAAAGAGATISGWTLTGPDGSASGTGASGTLTLAAGKLVTTGSQTYTVTITDSRGRTFSKNATAITVYAYAPPTLTGFSAYRSNSAGTSDPGSGTYLRTIATAGYSSVNGLNTATLGVSCKQTSATSYATNVAFTSGTAKIIGGSVTTGNSWNVRWQVTDKFTTTETVITIPSAAALIDAYDPGAGGPLWVGIGKRAEAAGLEIGLPTRFLQKIDSSVYLTPTESGGTSYPPDNYAFSLPAHGGLAALKGTSGDAVALICGGGATYIGGGENGGIALNNPGASVDRESVFIIAENGTIFCGGPNNTPTPNITAVIDANGNLYLRGNIFALDTVLGAFPGDPVAGGIKTSPTKTGNWIEEQLDTNLYRWTQIVTVTNLSPSVAWGNLFYVTQNLPAKPSGATITAVQVSSGVTSGNAWAVAAQASSWACVWYAAQPTTVSGTLVVTAYGTKP